MVATVITSHFIPLFLILSIVQLSYTLSAFSVVDLNTLYLDMDPEFWPNLDPDLGPDPEPGLCYQF